MHTFGLRAHDNEIDAVFKSFDLDGGGEISYEELNKS